MARIDYTAIEEELLEILRSSDLLDGVTIDMERYPDALENVPLVALFFRERLPDESQPLAAGKRQRWELRYSLYCVDTSFDDTREAMRKRDDLMSRVEDVLMENRTISGRVTTGWLAGGELSTAVDERLGSVAEGEVQFHASVTVTT